MDYNTRVLCPINMVSSKPIITLVDFETDEPVHLTEKNYTALVHEHEYGVPAHTTINPNTWKYANNTDLLNVLRILSNEGKDKITVPRLDEGFSAFSSVARGIIQSDEHGKYYIPVLPAIPIKSQFLMTSMVSNDFTMFRYVDDASCGFAEKDGEFNCIVFCTKPQAINPDVTSDLAVFVEGAVASISSLPMMMHNSTRFIGISLEANEAVVQNFGPDFHGMVKLLRDENLNIGDYYEFVAKYGDTFMSIQLHDSSMVTFSPANTRIPSITLERLKVLLDFDIKYYDTFSDEIKKLYNPTDLRKEAMKLLSDYGLS